MALRLWVLLMAIPFAARADEDAKALYERGTALFALHHFSEAAIAYEKAFELKPDKAILYNAAQAHRLAGEKARALDLYQSLLKLYANKLTNRAEIIEHVRQLNIAIEAERKATSSPPVTPAPRTPEPTPPQLEPVPQAAVVVEKPVQQRKWLWPVVGTSIGVVVAGVTLGLVFGLSKTVDPSASFGTVHGN